MMVLCKEWSLVKRKGSLVEVEPLYCKCWHCPTCQPRRSKRLIGEAMDGQPQRFLTLTINPALYDSPSDAAKAMVEGWRKMREAIKLYYDVKRYPFFAVFEATKKKWPHLHILVRGMYIPQWLLSFWWKEFTGSPVVDIRYISRRRNAARYVAKYVGKGPNQFVGCKRYWRSMDWLPEFDEEAIPEDLRGFVCQVDKRHWSTLLESFSAGPFVVEWDGEDASLGFRVYRVPP